MDKEYTISKKYYGLGCNVFACNIGKTFLAFWYSSIIDTAFLYALLSFLLLVPPFLFSFFSFSFLLLFSWDAEQMMPANMQCKIMLHKQSVICANQKPYRKNKFDLDVIISTDFGSATSGRFVLQKFFIFSFDLWLLN